MKKQLEETVIELCEGGSCTVEYYAKWIEGEESVGISDGWIIEIENVYVNIAGRIHPGNKEDIIFLYAASDDVDGINVTGQSSIDLQLIEEIILEELINQ